MGMENGNQHDQETNPLRMLFFPLMSPGHFVPMVDMVRLFAAHGVHCSLVTTPGNASTIARTLERCRSAGEPVSLLTIPFPPSSETGLPEGKENLSVIECHLLNKFVMAMFLFREPLLEVVRQYRPHCIVSDAIFPWTTDIAEEVGIPRLIFHGTGALPLYVLEQLTNYLPSLQGQEQSNGDGNSDGDGGYITMKGLPHPIRLHVCGLPELVGNESLVPLLQKAQRESFGVVLNTFKEMEPSYVDYFVPRGLGGSKAWCVGPVALCNRELEEKNLRGDNNYSASEVDRIIHFLDDHTHQGSDPKVVYLGFGSLCNFGKEQILEIAKGLEESGHPFLWVIRKEVDCLPEGFEDRTRNRGLVVKGWAPQVRILNHPAIGWFVTHCGWNSLSEAVCAGVPMITWPLSHEQFINEVLVTDVMRVGIRMWDGFRRNLVAEECKVLVTAQEISTKLNQLVHVDGVRKRVRDYSLHAQKSVEEGGSTYNDITRLIEELKSTASKYSPPIVEHH